MERPLPVLSAPEPARSCVWVDAGVLNYRLCDRGFACESCPLDAAIRGDPRLIVRSSDIASEGVRVPWEYPRDRLYTDGHAWVQVVDPQRVRTGIDACAACLLAPLQGAQLGDEAQELVRGKPLCVLQVEGGELAIESPVSGQVCGWNDSARTRPGLLTSDPYAAGWIAEIALTDRAELSSLRQADAAQEHARLAVRHFGRRAGLELLVHLTADDPWITQELLEATRRVVGPETYLSLLCGVLA